MADLGDEGCDQVLIIGGNSSEGAIAEIIVPGDESAAPAELTSDDLPSAISWPGLCGDALVSGSGSDSGVGAMSAAVLDVISGELKATILADESSHGTKLGSSVAQAESCFPFLVWCQQRPLPNGHFEEWDVNEFVN